MLTMILTIAI